jgi:lipopolysaccharide export system protein LptA
MAFDRERHILDFTGRAGIYEKENYLKCEKIRGYLTDDNKTFTRFTASENLVVYFPAVKAPPEDGGESGGRTLFFSQAAARRLTAGALSIDFAEDGVTFERAHLEGGVRFEIIPEDQNKEVKVLHCDQADLTFFEGTSQLKQLDAGGQVRIVVYPRDDRGLMIREESREFRSRTLRAIFDEETNEVEEIFMEDDLVFTFGDIRSTGRSAYYNVPEDTLTLKGRPKVTDGRSRIVAREIRLDQANHMVTASGRVKAVTYPDQKEGGGAGESLMSFTDEPVLFLSETMRMDYRTKHVWFEGHVKVSQADNEIYAKQVELDNASESMEATGDVKSIFKPSEADRGEAVGGLLDAREAVYFWSDAMRIEQGEDTIRFIDNVRVLQGENTITTQEMIIFNREKRFIARGGVKSVYLIQETEEDGSKKAGRSVLTTARVMAYDEKEDKIIYLQDVRVKEGQDRYMEGERVELFLSGDRDHIRHVRLKENVFFRRDWQEGSGDQADYYPAEGKIVLTGKKAKFERGGGLTTMGNILTFYFESGRIVADSLEDGRLKTLYSPGQEINSKDVDADAGD